MGTIEIKEKLINRINAIQDVKLLKEIDTLINLDQDLYEEEVYALSKEQEIALLKSYEEVKGGKFLMNEEADKEADQWLE